jgi:hypothetical protein
VKHIDVRFAYGGLDISSLNDEEVKVYSASESTSEVLTTVLTDSNGFGFWASVDYILSTVLLLIPDMLSLPLYPHPLLLASIAFEYFIFFVSCCFIPSFMK